MTAIGLWYSESINYDYSNPSYSDDTGHFTALVWQASTQVGFGVAQLPDDEWFVVASFAPAGNTLGQFSQNVLQ